MVTNLRSTIRLDCGIPYLLPTCAGPEYYNYNARICIFLSSPTSIHEYQRLKGHV